MAKRNLKFRERDVSRAIRGVSKAGVSVGRVMIDHDGNIVVIASPAGESRDTSSELDKWLGEHPDAGQTQGH